MYRIINLLIMRVILLQFWGLTLVATVTLRPTPKLYVFSWNIMTSASNTLMQTICTSYTGVMIEVELTVSIFIRDEDNEKAVTQDVFTDLWILIVSITCSLSCAAPFNLCLTEFSSPIMSYQERKWTLSTAKWYLNKG